MNLDGSAVGCTPSAVRESGPEQSGPDVFELMPMTTIMPIDEPRPRGTIIGRQVSGPPLTEADHFKLFPLCGGYVDMRDRVWLEEHQGSLPHPACDRAQ
jgi:hypothetical protein